MRSLTTAIASPLRLLWLLFLLCAVVAAVDPRDDSTDSDDSDGPTTAAENDVPNWAADNALQLTLTPSGSHPSPLQYTVIPLTKYLGLNGTDEARGIVQISGNMIAAGPSNYNTINNDNDVAYLSCDESSDNTFIDPTQMLQKLMDSRPRAIVLYSTSGNWCSLNDGGDGDDLTFTSILSMADAAEAANALGYLNGTASGKVVKVSISGNRTSNESDDGGHGKSTVAMSVLYSITGIIALLFLSIIVIGAVRAHRYPERYGPRGALGGRPRQSRAKGLARAVLETIPIVKFGNQPTTKPDPDLELETATMDGQEIAMQRTASNLTEDARPGPAPAASEDEDRPPPPTIDSAASRDATKSQDGRLGCSICTEDFNVGEDVRVLPCSHQYHPSCIDPWLVNVSGTCPLCRLDLRPGQSNEDDGSPADRDDAALPPPLVLEGEDGDATTATHRNRLSRIFDINRLRQATVEEQMEALRQMRAEGERAEGDEHAAQSPEGAEGLEADGEERRRGAGFTDKLRERFRIRTRAQSPHRRDS